MLCEGRVGKGTRKEEVIVGENLVRNDDGLDRAGDSGDGKKWTDLLYFCGGCN